MRHVVVIGLGAIGRRHAENLATMHPGVRITIVRHRPVVDEFCRQLNATVVTSLEAIDGHVDLAVLATPSANHIETLPGLIDRAWPLLVEKPVVTSVDHIETIRAQLLDAQDAPRVAGFNLRHLPSLERMRSAIESGMIGRPIRASFTAGQWLPDWRPQADYRTVYSADAFRGGGVELDLSHEFDAARWFFGDLTVSHARGGRFSDLEIDANDVSISLLEPAHGRGPLVTVTLDYVARRRVRTYDVVGDDGRLVWHVDGGLDLITSSGRETLTDEPIDFNVAETYRRMLARTDSFAATGDGAAVQSLEDGLASSRLAIDVREWARKQT